MSLERIEGMSRSLQSFLTKLRKGVVRPAAVLLTAALAAPSPAFAASVARVSINVTIQGISNVTDLVAAPGTGVGTIDLTWTEPYVNAGTPPYSYDMRVSSVANINTNAEFLAASPLSVVSTTTLPIPGPGGGGAGLTIVGLTPGVTYYFALRERDLPGTTTGSWIRSVPAYNPDNAATAKSIFPAAIADLAAAPGPVSGDVELSWTAPSPGPLLTYGVYFATFSVAGVGGSTAAWTASASSTTFPAVAPPGAPESVLLSGLAPGASYWLAVNATNTSGTSLLDSAAAGVQISTRARGFTGVADLVAAPGGISNSVQLTWTEPFTSSATLPVTYQIRVSTLGFINGATDFLAAPTLSVFSTATIPAFGAGGAAKSMLVTGLLTTTTYYFALRAVDASTPTLAGTWLRAPALGRNPNTGSLPLFVPNPPNPITDLFASTGTVEGEVALYWTAPSNANFVPISSYEVRYATFSTLSVGGSTAAWYAAASTAGFSPALAPGAPETRSVFGLAPNSTWYFAIKSRDVSGVVSPIDVLAGGASQAASLPKNLPPATPAAPLPTAGMRRVGVTWSDLSPAGKGLDFSAYRLERSTDLATFVGVTTTTAFAFTDTPLKARTTYYYRLVARDQGGLESVPSATGFAVPYTILPMEPLGVTVSASSTTTTLGWSPTTRFGDGTPFLSTGTPDTDELIGYAVYRSTAACSPDFVHVSSLTLSSTSVINITSGLNYFYRLASYNTQGVSTNVITVSSLGDRSFFADDCVTTVAMDAQNARILNAATNGLGADVRILRTRRPQDTGGMVFQSVEWKAYLNGVTEMKGFTLSKPARVVLRFETSGGAVVPSTAPVVGAAGYAAGAAAPVAVSPSNVGMYWHNGGEFKKMYGRVDPLTQTVTVETPNLGLYQVRALYRGDGAVFDLSNVSGRVITPNGDGLNDVVIFTYDPGPTNAQAAGRIFDVTGASVADMAPGLVPSTLTWDGRANGRPVSSGVYVYRVTGDGKTFTGTVVIAR